MYEHSLCKRLNIKELKLLELYKPDTIQAFEWKNVYVQDPPKIKKIFMNRALNKRGTSSLCEQSLCKA